MYKTIPPAMLRVGMVLGAPIHDQAGKKLLASGITITETFLFGLFKRGIRSVAVAEQDWARMAAFSSQGQARNALPNRTKFQTRWNRQATWDLDDALRERTNCDIVASERPFSQRIEHCGSVSHDPLRMDHFFSQHQHDLDQISDLLRQLSEGHSIAADAVHKICFSFLKRAAEDMDLFVCMGINPVAYDSIFAHSANVATLAIAIGAVLGLDDVALTELGTGCLVHDAGMQRVRPEVYQAERVLDECEFSEITKHPIIASEMLYQQVDGISLGVRMVIYQMHERCNGSGYPRGWTAERIHPLARIAAVADAYVAMVSDRPYRKALLPYYAITRILEDVHDGLYDSVVARGLLHTIALFPIGSYVELSSGQVGRVIRSNGPAYDRPVIEAWNRKQLTRAPQVIDLTTTDISVVRALTKLSA